MAHLRTRFRSLAALSVFALAGTVQADMGLVTMLELAEESKVTFVGTVTAVGKDAATVAVGEVLAGKLQRGAVSVTPIHIQHCTGSSLRLTVAEAVLIFGKVNEAGQVVIAAHGQGKIRLEPARRQETIQAAKRLLAIAPLQEREKNKAMLALIRSPNRRLSTESRYYIGSKISHSKIRDEYNDDLVSLIQADDPVIQATGLQGMEFVKAPEAIPRMVELTRSKDIEVVRAASMALGKYDTPESTAALIALTKHKEFELVSRACIDLDTSRRPEAKEALKKLLYHQDPKIRAMALRGLVMWLRHDKADDVLPRLVEMLDDPDLRVRTAAADSLGETRNSAAVPPLLAVLREDPQGKDMKRLLVQSLSRHYSYSDAKARELIDQEIELIIAALKSGDPRNSFGPAFRAVRILRLSPKAAARDALKWAAESHPNEEIKAYAKRSLPKP